MHLRSATSRGRALDGRITVRQLLDHTSGLDDYFLHTPIDKALQADPDASGRSGGRSSTSASRISRRERGGTTPTPTTCTSASSPNESRARRWQRRSGSGSSIRSTSTQRGTRPSRSHRARLPMAIDSRTQALVSADRPVGEVPGGAVPVGRDGRGRSGLDRGNVRRRGPLGPAPLHGRGARPGDDGPDAGGRGVHGRVFAARPLWARRPGVPDHRAIRRRPQRSPAWLRSAVRHLPAENVTIAVLTNQSRADPAVIVADCSPIVFEPSPPCVRCAMPL